MARPDIGAAGGSAGFGRLLSGAAPTTRVRGLGSWLQAHVALVGFCAGVGLFYLWIVQTSTSGGLGDYKLGYYNMLTEGFLHGHLRLLELPSPELLKLPNPFDPIANYPVASRDLSLYNNHYYLYWGPTPAVVAFAPLRLIGIDLPQATATLIFAFAGFCFSVAVLRELAARFAAGAPRWMLGAGALVLALGNVLPFMLRRTAVYEVAIAAGFCFCFIAMYFVVTAFRGDHVSRRRLALASGSIGLAVGSRPTMIVVALAMFVLAVWLWRDSTDKAEGRRILVAALGPLAVLGTLLVAYNVARFGNALEFGQSYQLAGEDFTKKQWNQPAYVPPGVWYYLFSPPSLSWGFPFIQLASNETYPLSAPSSYTAVESVSGLLVSVPFTLFAFAGLVVARGMTRVVIGALCAIGLSLMFMTSFAVWGASERYELDFATFLLIAGVLGWIVWAGRLEGPAKNAVVAGGGCLAALAVLFGICTSMTGYDNSLMIGSPGTYNWLQRITQVVPTIGSSIEGRPLLLSAQLSDQVATDTKPGSRIGALSFRLASGRKADLAVVSGSRRRYGLVLSGAPSFKSAGKASVAVRVAQSGDYHLIKAGGFGRTVVPIKVERGLNHIYISASGPGRASTDVAGVKLVPLGR